MSQEFTDKNLLFILSQPRSGSTMLQLMLSGHPDIATTSEPWIALHPFYQLRHDGISAEYNSRLAQDAFEDFLNEGGVTKAQYKAKIADNLLYLYRLHTERQGKNYFLDKTPRYYFIAEDLAEVFPNARFIILFRNPLAVLNSIIDSWVKEDLLRLSEYRHDLLTGPLRLIQFVKNNPDKSMVIGYEKLSAEPLKEMNRVCRFIEIPITEKILNYDKNKPADWLFGDKIGVNTMDRPSTAHAEKWSQNLSNKKRRYLLASYLEALGPEIIDNMGYNYEFLSGKVGSVEKPDDILPWRILIRENSSLKEGLELNYWQARIKGGLKPLRFVMSAAIYGLEYSEKERKRGAFVFWLNFLAAYLRKIQTGVKNFGRR